MPLISSVDKITRSYVAGWIADSDNPEQPLDVLIYVNGEGRGRITANLARPDLAAAFPGATGNHAFRFEFGWPLSPFRANEVEIFEARERRLLRAGKHTLPAQGGDNPTAYGPTPLFVTSTGRSGSSLLMGRLAAHPEIAVAGSHPFEVKQLTYYAGALRTLSMDANWARSVSPDGLLSEASRYVIGFNPYYDPQFGTHPRLDQFWEVTRYHILRSALRETIVAYYDAIREITQKLNIRYIAEKAHPNPLLRDGVMAMFGGIKEILLVRDPRDLVCSYRSFWGSAPSDAVSLIRSQFNAITERVEAAMPDTFLVKYEDLVLQPVQTLEGLCGFLGLREKSPATSSGETAIFASHGTSKSPEASIGRWRTDLTLEQRRLCDAAFSDFLPKLGYALE